MPGRRPARLRFQRRQRVLKHFAQAPSPRRSAIAIRRSTVSCLALMLIWTLRPVIRRRCDFGFGLIVASRLGKLFSSETWRIVARATAGVRCAGLGLKLDRSGSASIANGSARCAEISGPRHATSCCGVALSLSMISTVKAWALRCAVSRLLTPLSLRVASVPPNENSAR